MNLSRTVAVAALLSFAGIAAASAALESLAVPARSSSNKSLAVPDEHKKLGTVYYSVKTPPTRGIKFKSEAANENFTGIATDVAGYAVAGPAENPGKLAGGAWRVGVKSIDTGIPMRNEHLQESGWLNANANPDITFALKEVTDVKLTKEMQNGPKTYMGTLKGEMTINGKSKDVEIPNTTMIFVPTTPAMEKQFKGDLLSLRCKYDIALADYGVTNKTITGDKKVAEIIKVDQELTLATVPPEEQPELKLPEPRKPESLAPAGDKAKPDAAKPDADKKKAPAPKATPVGG